ncbi:MAG TPA: UPF0175 family protein [Bryobacteraceae bacterium]|jgi:hypothetical protein|nr:UPF0175 family protein [Bryobacteraceae bacterium]
MVVTLDLPDNIARALTDQSDVNLQRRALEALAIEGYRERRLTQKQVGELLGLTRIQAEDFLAAHLDLYDCEPAELTRETEHLKDFSERQR